MKWLREALLAARRIIGSAFHIAMCLRVYCVTRLFHKYTIFLGLWLEQVVHRATIRVDTWLCEVKVVDSFGVIVRVRVGIWVYVKPFCSAEKQ